ncbi:aminotransferase class V-fold PLP-dependent enzyme [candidate division WOR-3 bacterium]|uniref:Aminotransferase class V-fold PLP-dependent enzyme n=1 Tax=candidate division WOR-3 bacterium TaxID=2052148 RepID=A0A9D5QCX1_UNCW3|nr:aminotransferase class V-fold PLP-dependent enzyme [candidate division WOR-3 bacterium]MBD3364497.1 aminotransferase class V-fold PLP-dependent enzyme [candidate division WOR-3 bacterium]
MVNYRLFTPGPIEVTEDVLSECGKVFPYHRDPSFAEVVNKTTNNLKDILFTDSRVFFFTSSGTGGMEAAVANLFSEGDEVLITSVGKFGQRWREIADAYHLKVHYLRFDLGKSADPSMIAENLAKCPTIKAVLTTHTETSTGALNNVAEIGRIVRSRDRLFVLDAIAGLGADELRMDPWKVDVVIGGSQKAIGAPPGLSLVAVNERAWTAVSRSRLPKYYFNMQIAEKFRQKGFTPWTPAIPAMMALARSLDNIAQKGIDKVWEAHEKWATFFRKKALDLGFTFMPERPSNALSVIKFPEGVDTTEIICAVRDKEGILLANGQQELKGHLIRVGHMGHANEADTLRALEVLEKYALPKLKEGQ